jgi:hypothetical protein
MNMGEIGVDSVVEVEYGGASEGLEIYDFSSTVETPDPFVLVYFLKTIEESLIFDLSLFAADESPAHGVGGVGEDDGEQRGAVGQHPLFHVVLIVLEGVEDPEIGASEDGDTDHRDGASGV